MQSKAERTKQLIIEKTAPIFNIKGYSGTSINDIINATGLTKGSIYGNFENKDDVALASFDYNFQRVVFYIRAKISEQISTIDKLLVYPEVYRSFFRLPFLISGCPIMNTSIEADDTHPALKERASNALSFWRNSLERYLSLGIEKNEIKSDVDIKEFTAVFIALIQGGVMQAKLTGNVNCLNETMNFLEKMINNLKK